MAEDLLQGKSGIIWADYLPESLSREAKSCTHDSLKLFCLLHFRGPRPLSQLCLLLGAVVLPGKGFADLGQNYVFMAGFWGWFLAQSCKVHIATCTVAELLSLNNAVICRNELLQIFTKRWRKGVWDLKAIVDSGGMPSSHSALCSVRQLCTSQHACMMASLNHTQQCCPPFILLVGSAGRL